MKVHGNTREHAKCHFGIGKDENGRSKRKRKIRGRSGRERGSKTLSFIWREKENFLYFHFWKLFIFMCFDKMFERRLQENVKQRTILMHNCFALIKLTINVQLFIDRWNGNKSLKLSLKLNFEYKLIVLIINKQCSWMKFIAHVVGCMHETRWLMKYIYGWNWPHKCSRSTCESNYMDQLWWHQPN